MKKDDFGNRMKEYEKQFSQKAIPLLPVCVRLDGKGFSKFTKGLKRPYDKRLSDLMVDTAKYLVKETGAIIGYTQSDEISLIYYSDNYKKQIFFDGKFQKLSSVLASMCASYFNYHKAEIIPEKKEYLANFDCRVWQVPNKEEAANVLLWREKDATKNSISMASRCYYSHKELLNKSANEIQEMLFQKGVNWNDYPRFFKRGTFIQKKSVIRRFTKEELNNLSAKHEVMKNPDVQIERTVFEIIDMPCFTQVINRVNVIFDGDEPLTNIKEEIK